MRTIFNTLMVALVVAALFWGNCFSCPQMLLTLHSQQPAHGCCHRTKRTTENCQTQVLRHFVKAEVVAAFVPVVSSVVGPVPAMALPHCPSQASSIPVVHTPPDLLSLHSNFRI
jgi:hypothetical protein